MAPIIDGAERYEPGEELPASAIPYPEGQEPPLAPAMTAERWANRPQPPGYKAAIAMGRVTDKLMLSIVGRTYQGESDPRFDTKDQLVKIRILCDIIEEARGLG